MTLIGSTCMAGFGHAIPRRCVANAEIEAQLGLEFGWIEPRTGIRTRYWAEAEETLTGLAAEAGRMALMNAGSTGKDVALTLLATSTPDHLLPPSAPLLAHKLGLENSGAIDLAGACSGFLYALALADAFVRAHGRAVLVVAANILSRRINQGEKASSILFADAAGAVVLIPQKDADRGLLATELSSDGSGYDLIQIPGGGSNRPFKPELGHEEFLMNMRDGREVFCRAVNLMTEASQKVLKQSKVPIQGVDRFVPHQANARMFEAIGRNLGIESGRTVNTIESYGNSSAATIPLSLSISNQQKQLAEGEYVLLTAAGAGLVGGALMFRT